MTKTTDSHKKLFSNIAFMAVLQMANYLLPLISIPIIVRIIGPANFGIINFFTSFTAYFVVLINYGFDYTATRFVVKHKKDTAALNAIFSQVFYAKILLFILSCSIFLIVLTFVPAFQTEKRTAICAFFYCSAFVITPNWLYQGMEDLRKISIFNIIAKILFTIFVLWTIRTPTDYYWQPLALSSTQIAVGIISFFYAKQSYRLQLNKWNFHEVKMLLWDGRLIFLSMISVNLFTDSNIFLLGLFENSENVGYFAASWKLVMVLLMVISFPISQALYPYIGQAFNDAVTVGIKKLQRIIPLIFYFSVSVSVVLFFLGGFIIVFFYGESFRQAIPVFRILCLIPILSLLNTTLTVQALLNLKKDKIFFRISLLGGVFSVLFNLIVIQLFGYLACAWAWVFTEMMMVIYAYWSLQKMQVHLFKKLYFNPRYIMRAYAWPVYRSWREKNINEDKA